MEGKFGSIIVKASYGARTRKWKQNLLSILELVSTIRREFGIESGELRLTYKDSGKHIPQMQLLIASLDGDYIELSNDEDLALAAELEKTITLMVSNESVDGSKPLSDFRSSLTTLISNATEVFNSFDNLNFSEKKPANTRDSIASPIKNEAIATIDPSVLEEVYLNDAPNGVHESKPVYDNGIQVRL